MTGAYTGITGLGALTSLTIDGASSPAITLGDWSGASSNSAIESNSGHLILGFGTGGAVYLRTINTNPVYIGANSSNTLQVGNGTATVVGTMNATTFSGSGASLTSLPAAQLTGFVNSARLSGSYSGITGVGTLSSLTVTGGVITTSLAPTSDGVLIYGNGTGSSSRRVSIYPASLTASRDFILPNVTGTAITTGNLSSITAVGTLASGSIPASLLTGVGAGIGCDLVKTQAIGAGVSSVVVTGAFSSTYDMYRIFIQTDSIAAGGPYMTLQMGSTTTGYYWGAATVIYSSAAASNINNNNTSSWNRLGPGTTGGMTGVYDLLNPFKSEVTVISGSYADPSTAGSAGYGSGFLNNTTSYTGFTIGLTSSTMTGGSIRIYGFK
jgi:hypothetical protein